MAGPGLLRKIGSAFLIALTSVSLSAQTTGAAVLYGTGTVFLNGAQLSNSSAVTAGDVIQTKENGVANLNGAGSTVVIESNSIVRYQGDGLSLDRGSLSVATGKGTSVYARDFKITPATGEWTEFYVTRVSGSIGIIARKSAVTISCGMNTTTIKEGQQVSRDDAPNCGFIAKTGRGAPTAAKAPILGSNRAELGALAAGAVLAGWALAHTDDPVSPSLP